jgi:hypothetical protein
VVEFYRRAKSINEHLVDAPFFLEIEWYQKRNQTLISPLKTKVAGPER